MGLELVFSAVVNADVDRCGTRFSWMVLVHTLEVRIRLDSHRLQSSWVSVVDLRLQPVLTRHSLPVRCTYFQFSRHVTMASVARSAMHASHAVERHCLIMTVHWRREKPSVIMQQLHL